MFCRIMSLWVTFVVIQGKVDFEFLGLDFSVDVVTFSSMLPRLCLQVKASQEECEGAILHVSRALGLTVNNVMVYDGPVPEFQGLIIPIVEGVDVRQTAHGICVEMPLHQNACAMLHHISALLTYYPLKEMQLPECSPAYRELYLQRLGVDLSLPRSSPLPADAHAGWYTETRTFPFDGNDEKVLAFLECLLRTNLHWPAHAIHVLDVGAHEGGFLNSLDAAVARATSPSAIASTTSLSFEPNPVAFQALRSKFRNRNAAAHFVRAALSDENDDSGGIFVPEAAWAAELASLSPFAVPGTLRIPTPVWTLDEYLHRFGVQGQDQVNTLATKPKVHARTLQIELLKIDVEGFEPKVLAGASRLLNGTLPGLEPPRAILFEYSQAWTVVVDTSVQRLETVVEDLRVLNYRCFLLGETSLIRLDGSCWFAALEFWFWSNIVCLHEKEASRLTAIEALYEAIGAQRSLASGGHLNRKFT